MSDMVKIYNSIYKMLSNARFLPDLDVISIRISGESPTSMLKALARDLRNSGWNALCRAGKVFVYLRKDSSKGR